MDLAPFIVCPETLGPLEPVEGGHWSPRAERLYATRQGLVFMGYPARDAAMIESTMEEERVWQGTGEAAAMNLEFLRSSAPSAVDLINIAQEFVPWGERRPRAVELGCGNGWVSWLLAEAGYDTWMCDFEANSLASGLNLKHPNLGEGKRFVTDARYAPFADESFDLVLLKQFVHHVADHGPLFSEAARILKEGGIMVLMEPVRSLWGMIYERLEYREDKEGHHMAWPGSYLRGIRAAGMEVVHQSPEYAADANRRWPADWMKKHAVASIDAAHPAGNWLAWLQLRLFGGAQLIVIARKNRRLKSTERPPMIGIDPDKLVFDDQDLAGYAEFPAVLQDAAGRLKRPFADDR